MRIVFMGTPDFAVESLKALVEAGENIVRVVTRPDRERGRGKRVSAPPVKVFALRHGLDVVQPENLRDPSVIDLLKALAPEVIVVVAYGRILPPAVLNIPPLGCVNVHASLLPKYRGAAPIHRAIMAGETETGVTTMILDQGMDTGDMLLQVRVPIGPEDNVGEIHDRLALEGGRLLVRTLARMGEGYLFRVPQDHRQATYAPPLTRGDELIDWHNTAQMIYNQVRGLDPWPGAVTYWGDKRLKIWSATVVDGRFGPPGLVTAATPLADLVVAAGSGGLAVRQVQVAGGRRMEAGAFLRGHPEINGAVLGDNVLGRPTV